jgi:hypothetical protein
MTQVHGKNAKIFIDDQTGACRNASGDLNAVTLNWTKTAPETTTFGGNSVARGVDGQRDFTADITALFSSGSIAEITPILDSMIAGSLATRIQIAPAGCVSGCPLYTASVRITSRTMSVPVDGVVTENFSVALAAASVVTACVT